MKGENNEFLTAKGLRWKLRWNGGRDLIDKNGQRKACKN